MSTAQTGTPRRSPARYALIASVAAMVGSAAACSDGGEVQVAPADIGHVHDLVADQDDRDVLLVATHRGLVRLDDGSYRAVGDELHDLMALTRGPGGDLLASGHPDRRLEKYWVDGGPSVLGLVRSTDAGQSWDVDGLLGEVDFHALVPTDDGIVGGDSTGRIWQFDADGDGQPAGSVPFDINDLAVAPDDRTVVVATSWDGEVAVSDDAGQTWELQPQAPSLFEVEWTAAGITGATTDGQLWQATDPRGPFELVGAAPEDVEALLVSDADVWLATHGGQIHRREPDGSWTMVVTAE